MNNPLLALWEKLSLLLVSGKDADFILNQFFVLISSVSNLYRGRIRLFHHEELFLQSDYQWNSQNRDKKNKSFSALISV